MNCWFRNLTLNSELSPSSLSLSLSLRKPESAKESEIRHGFTDRWLMLVR
ncbi:hypothetical protein Hanom_Chr04g00340361 [Helianthus anomalus]